MIEGLRVFPYYQDARLSGTVIGSKGCEECKQTVNVAARQDLGCGWEPAVADARPWTPSPWVDRGDVTAACAGYTTTLPSVQEVVAVYPQWERGTLAAYLDDVSPPRLALDYLAALHSAIELYRADVMRPKAKD